MRSVLQRHVESRLLPYGTDPMKKWPVPLMSQDLEPARYALDESFDVLYILGSRYQTTVEHAAKNIILETLRDVEKKHAPALTPREPVVDPVVQAEIAYLRNQQDVLLRLLAPIEARLGKLRKDAPRTEI